ncbi:UNVERIFIED_CONTAM: hypothetical protein K2H54_039906 [Gekko kuhli]
MLNGIGTAAGCPPPPKAEGGSRIPPNAKPGAAPYSEPKTSTATMFRAAARLLCLCHQTQHGSWAATAPGLPQLPSCLTSAARSCTVPELLQLCHWARCGSRPATSLLLDPERLPACHTVDPGPERIVELEDDEK